MEGDTLVARCRRADGRADRTSLAEIHRCTGDIGNINGNLQCNYGGPPQAQAPYPGPRYGQAPGYGAPGGPGPREGYGSDFRERCAGVHHEAEELRHRLEREGDPTDRARIEGRLRELHEQEERLVALMEKIEPKLDTELHDQVTQLLCELTAYDLMHVLYTMDQARPKTVFQG